MLSKQLGTSNPCKLAEVEDNGCYEGLIVASFESWIESEARQGKLPNELNFEAQSFLLKNKIVLPGKSVLDRTIVTVISGLDFYR